ncbi:MAG: FTR1 family protein [Terrimicrobiaceae bacterium]|nr:FTR1 family protein [Terrimicrobiaceae bacterium]
MRLPLLASLALLAVTPVGRADVLDGTDAAQSALDDLALAAVARRVEAGQPQRAALDAFGKQLRSPEARALWEKSVARLSAATSFTATAETLGTLRGALQQTLALEMLAAYRAGDIDVARQARAAIKLPKHASAVEGLLALQRIGGAEDQRAEVARLLARETLVWQGSRARERTDDLLRLAKAGRATPELVSLRAAEIQALTTFPSALLAAAKVTGQPATAVSPPGVDAASIAAWKASIEGRLPDLLSSDEVEHQERLVVKLLRLVPMEYRNGVRDGQIAVPLEYREAVSFTVQAQQLLVEVRPNWLKTKSAAMAAHGTDLEGGFVTLEETIVARGELASVERECKNLSALLQDKFGVSLRKAGKGSDVVQETALEIRSLLGQSLQSARTGQWREANALRLEAYTTFDLEIESRILPRDPDLATRAERSFLDGGRDGAGIKAVLDQHAQGAALEAPYERTLEALDGCVALLRVGLSPTTVSITAFTIVLREGLEAVVILAALLAGLRGPENADSRRQVGIGAFAAVIVSAITFLLARTVISSLSRYGETLEAVISILAVIILLIVTNWVFHKYYWTGWNTRLRELKDKAALRRGQRWESFAMCGVGFLTIYREGFETTLFMQSLILEGGVTASLTGLFAGLAVIGIAGWAIFRWGMKLPYRKLLVVTGALVVTILATFLGSTVRLFQTIGWMPIHPIHGLEIPTWMGTWLGLYPSWEGLLIPFLGFVYVGIAWLFVRWQGQRKQAAFNTYLQTRREHPQPEATPHR